MKKGQKKIYETIVKELKSRRVALLATDKALNEMIEENKNARHGDEIDIAEADSNRSMSFQRKNLGSSELNKIDLALAKIRSGEYGVCDECGETIPLNRLKALPYSTYCLGCQEDIEKERIAR